VFLKSKEDKIVDKIDIFSLFLKFLI